MNNDRFAGTLRPVKGSSVSATVLQIITDGILARTLRPGDRLPTLDDFAAKLGVGRGSVREAITALATMGVVETRPGRGTFVTKQLPPAAINPLIVSLVFEQGSSDELVEIRLAIDSATVEILAAKRLRVDLSPLEAANEELGAEAAKGSPDAIRLRDLDLRFHGILYSLAGNRFLTRIAEAIYMLSRDSIERSLERSIGNNPMHAYGQHRLLIEAIRSGDPAKARNVLRDSLVHWIEVTSRPGRVSQRGEGRGN